MPRAFKYILTIVAVLALVPPSLVALMRAKHSPNPRIHLVPDMDNQQKFKAQSVNPLFADSRSMRPGVPGTVARGMLQEDTHFYEGRVDGEWAKTFPLPVDAALMVRGQERFNIYCAPCHGFDGAGTGIVNVRAERLMEGLWVPPVAYHDRVVREREHGHLFNTITNGIRNMPAYGDQIAPRDRWAIVAYVRALQRSQNANLEDVDPAYRDELK